MCLAAQTPKGDVTSEVLDQSKIRLPMLENEKRSFDSVSENRYELMGQQSR